MNNNVMHEQALLKISERESSTVSRKAVRHQQQAIPGTANGGIIILRYPTHAEIQIDATVHETGFNSDSNLIKLFDTTVCSYESVEEGPAVPFESVMQMHRK